MNEPHKVGEILDCLDQMAEGQDSVSVEDVVGSFGKRTFGPVIMVPALLELSPVGAIPGVPTFLAVTIAILAAQKMFGREHLWLPGWIGHRCVSSDKLRKSTKKLRPIAAFMDRHFHGRLKSLTHAPFSRIAAGMVILLCATVPFLEVLPFASSGPMLAIAMFGLAVLVRDGALMVGALLISVAAFGMGYDYVDGGMSDTEQADGVVSEENVEKVKESADKASESIGETRDKAVDALRETAEEVRTKAAEGEPAAETGSAGAGASGDAGED